MSQNQDTPSGLPDIKELCLEIPLYKSIPFTKDDAKYLYDIRFFSGNFDCYCVKCEELSVFSGLLSGKEQDLLHSYYVRTGTFTEDVNYEKFLVQSQSERTFKRIFYCARNDQHRMIFIFYIHELNLTKIGQYPSLADIATVKIQKYRKVLKENFMEFSRGIGLAAHGIGIGAFIYLRRTFENLISEARYQAAQEAGWEEESYQRGRMDEKIVFLKNHLPPFLVDNRSLYSILSKGIHELTEQECLQAFPIVKVGIEMILDEKIQKQERKAKEAEARKAIGKLTQKLKGS